ncbi:MAG: DUF3592 domain-containing protein [Phycisphaeraceae bacterium]|nr:DUF3592 domain-containing protein [Phycisphaeraceae bacterium]
MNSGSIGLIGASIALILMGPIFIGKGGYEIYRTLDAKAWPTVSGEVTTSTVQVKETRRIGKPSSPRYELHIEYRYVVGDNEYSSDQITFGTTNKNSESYANTQLDKYPVGAAVNAHYNQGMPKEAALEVGFTLWTWVNLLMGIIGPLLGVPLIRWTLKTIKETNAEAKEAGLTSRPTLR